MINNKLQIFFWRNFVLDSILTMLANITYSEEFFNFMQQGFILFIKKYIKNKSNYQPIFKFLSWVIEIMKLLSPSVKPVTNLRSRGASCSLFFIKAYWSSTVFTLFFYKIVSIPPPLKNGLGNAELLYCNILFQNYFFLALRASLPPPGELNGRVNKGEETLEGYLICRGEERQILLISFLY